MWPVVIFFPDRKLGGGPYYLSGIAKELVKRGHKVFYIDYKDGYARKLCNPGDGITFLEYEDKTDRRYIWESCLVFAPIYLLHILPQFSFDSKILLFNWHHECLPVLKNNLLYSHAKLVALMDLICENDAQVFCDAAHRDHCNRISCSNFPEHYVPVHIKLKDIKKNAKAWEKTNKFDIAILGRITEDKISSIKNIIDFANASKYEVNIHIIGSDENNFLNRIALNSNVKIYKAGVLIDEDLNQYLIKNIDVLFAMGTSVLHGISLGIPGVIIPSSMNAFSMNSFIMLSDSHGYALGWYPSQIHGLPNKLKFDEVLQNLNTNYAEIVDSSIRYVKNNHSVELATDNFLKYISSTRLTYHKLFRFLVENQTHFSDTLLKKNDWNAMHLFGIKIITKKDFGSRIKYYLFNKLHIATLDKFNE